MKKFTTIFFSLLLVFLVLVPNTYAHVLQTDGSIGAVLHMNPEDDPVVGENTEIMFELKDTNNKFNPAMCNCTISVSDASKVLYQTAIFTADKNTEQMINVIFPQKGIYKITIKGIPHANSFQPFQLQYNIRVDREAQSTKTTADTFKSLLPLFLIPIAAFLILTLISSIRKKK